MTLFDLSGSGCDCGRADRTCGGTVKVIDPGVAIHRNRALEFVGRSEEIPIMASGCAPPFVQLNISGWERFTIVIWFWLIQVNALGTATAAVKPPTSLPALPLTLYMPAFKYNW